MNHPRAMGVCEVMRGAQTGRCGRRSLLHDLVGIAAVVLAVAGCGKSHSPSKHLAPDAGVSASDAASAAASPPGDSDAAPRDAQGGAATADASPAASIDASVADADVAAALDAAADASMADAGADAAPLCDPMADDCPDGQWCRRLRPEGGECVPFVGEGEGCGGWVRDPQFLQACEPELRCWHPAWLVDVGGNCKLPCDADEDCGNGRYCSAEYGVCFDIGDCGDALDCDAPNNDYAHDDCVGYGVCDRGCTWTCGEPACRDVASLHVGRGCQTTIGYAVQGESCTAIWGCDRGLPLFETIEECIAACTP